MGMTFEHLEQDKGGCAALYIYPILKSQITNSIDCVKPWELTLYFPIYYVKQSNFQKIEQDKMGREAVYIYSILLEKSLEQTFYFSIYYVK